MITLGVILFISILINVKSHYLLKEETNSKIDAMKLALELNKMNDEYIVMVDSLNTELDDYMYLQQLKKDLDRSWEGK